MYINCAITLTLVGEIAIGEISIISFLNLRRRKLAPTRELAPTQQWCPAQQSCVGANFSVGAKLC
jgi:hypothetical protein